MPARRHHELHRRKGPSQARSRETVRAILAAAARMFAVHGYAAGTTNRIAETAGVSVGSLYEHFPNKDALLVALMEAPVAEGQALPEHAAAVVTERTLRLHAGMRQLLDAMIALHARDRALHGVLFEEAPLPPHVRRRFARAEAEVAALVVAYLPADGRDRLRGPRRSRARRAVRSQRTFSS